MTLPVLTRRCGSCSWCCRIPAIPALGKPKDVWCGHCRPGHGGCSIYADRPEVCRDFACLWLSGSGPEALRPDRSKVMFTVTREVPPYAPHGFLVAHCDPRDPLAYQRAGARAFMTPWLAQGNPAIVVAGSQCVLLTRDPALQQKIMAHAATTDALNGLIP